MNMKRKWLILILKTKEGSCDVPSVKPENVEFVEEFMNKRDMNENKIQEISVTSKQ